MAVGELALKLAKDSRPGSTYFFQLFYYGTTRLCFIADLDMSMLKPKDKLATSFILQMAIDSQMCFLYVLQILLPRLR